MSVSPILIDDVIPRTQIIATASQTVFDTDWTADATTDVVVYRRADDEDADDQTQEVSSSLYNVTFIGDSATVRVTFLSGVDVDDIITIVRATPADRTNLYTNTNFTPSMLNEDFGILTLVDQQAQMYDQQSAPHYNLSCSFTDSSDLAIDMILPILPADYIWKKSSDNTMIEAVPIPSGTGSGTVNPGLENQLAWYVSDGDTISGLPTSNSKVLTTNSSGVPTWTATPYMAGIVDINGNNIVELLANASAVNHLRIQNGATGSGVILEAVGTDTNIELNLISKGTSGVTVQGTGTNDNADAGDVGEYISSIIVSGSAISLTTTTPANLTSISLTAGDWDVWGNSFFVPGDDTMIYAFSWISTTSATEPDNSLLNGIGVASGTLTTNGLGVSVTPIRISISTTTTVYISAVSQFGGTCTLCGGIYARRRR